MPDGKPIRWDSGQTAARDIDWIKPADKVFDAEPASMGAGSSGLQCNTCYNAVDRHVGRARRPGGDHLRQPGHEHEAHASPMPNCRTRWRRSPPCCRIWASQKGDRVVIYMPMIPEAGFAMLACARIGAIHSVVFGGFAAKELATRIDDAKPKVILSASCGIEGARVIPYKPLLDEAITLSASKPEACLVFQRPQLRMRRLSTAATGIGRAPSTPRGPKGARPNACRSRPPIRSTCSTPRARPACRRAWCATMAATWSRSNGPWATSSA